MDEGTAPSELSRLDDSYQLLEEVRRGGCAVTYLARHRRLGRDVMVTVVRAATPEGARALGHLAADVRLLSGVQHPNLVRVLEARWLSSDALAVVRVRVRGETLHEALANQGPMSVVRTVALLREIGGALEWARRTGIVHRGLTSDRVLFQQGSGRLLLSFGAAPVATDRGVARDDELSLLLARCSDVQTLGALGWEMLTARRVSVTPQPADLASPDDDLERLRPDISPEVAATIEEAMLCDRDRREISVPWFLAQLAAVSGADLPAELTPITPTTPTETRARQDTLRVPVRPRNEALLATPGSGDGWPTRDTAAAPVPSLWDEPGRGTRSRTAKRDRTATASAIVAGVAVVALLFATIGREQREPAPPDLRTAAARAAHPDSTVVGGEVSTHAPAVETRTVLSAPSTAAEPAPAPRPVARVAAPAPSPAGATASAAPSVAEESSARPRRASADGLGSCESPATADQRSCLLALLEESDTPLNHTYTQLIAALRRQAGTAPGAPDPPSVQQLRAEQRAWLTQRDTTCRRLGAGREGRLWATSRARCMSDLGAERTRELAARVERGGA